MLKTTKEIKRVAFFGDATLGPETSAYKEAAETAELLAKNGYVIVNGGGPGIMEAATEGAKKAHGKVELVIINPKSEPDNYEGSDKENVEFAEKVYQVNKIEDRLGKLIEIADAYVIFPGGTGTLAEVGAVWELAKFQSGHHEPVIFVGQEWAEVIKTLEEKMRFEALEKRVVMTVRTPDEVLRALTRVES